jgi:hypothetical protein
MENEKELELEKIKDINADNGIYIDGWLVTETYSGTETFQECFEKTIRNHIIACL